MTTGERSRRRRVAVIGGGAAGSLLALHLAELGIGAVVFDVAAAFGRGLAYAGGAAWHRINVPIEKVGPSIEGRADTFADWFAGRHGSFGADYSERFVPRSALGAWLSECVEARAGQGSLELRRDEVVKLVPQAGGIRVRCTRGVPEQFDVAVLCLGNQRARRLSDGSLPRVVEDIWRPGALAPVAGEGRVMIAGTGATGVDAVLDLVGRGHAGPITMVSRHGLLPLVDRAPEPYRLSTGLPGSSGRIRDVVARLRHEAARAARQGVGWQAVIDAFRPHVHALWSGLDPSERRRFDRHVRAAWLVHRHRLAPDIDALLQKLRREGRLTVLRGRLRDVRQGCEGLACEIVERGGPTWTGSAAWLLNCTGPEQDIRRYDGPLAADLLRAGHVRPGEFGIGFDVDGHGAVIDRRGRPSDRLFALGPATRSRFGEITSVPQIRARAAALARVIAAELAGARSATRSGLLLHTGERAPGVSARRDRAQPAPGRSAR